MANSLLQNTQYGGVWTKSQGTGLREQNIHTPGRILAHKQESMTLKTQHLFQNLLWYDISSETKFISLKSKILFALTFGRWRWWEFLWY
jgi:hypothetical protein